MITLYGFVLIFIVIFLFLINFIFIKSKKIYNFGRYMFLASSLFLMVEIAADYYGYSKTNQVTEIIQHNISKEKLKNINIKKISNLIKIQYKFKNPIIKTEFFKGYGIQVKYENDTFFTISRVVNNKYEICFKNIYCNYFNDEGYNNLF